MRLSASLTCVLLVLAAVLTSINAQVASCRPPFCADCFPWCPSSTHLCGTETIRTLCLKSCDACVTTSDACIQAGCEHNCEIQSDRTAICSCQDGYRLVDGKSCVDIDECSEDSTLCASEETNKLCRNDMGGYTCTICQSRENLWNYYEQSACCKLNNDGPTCGKSFSNIGRVVNGTLSKIGFWPWMAYIVISDIANGRPGLCGGSLISDRWVLSAGHCFETVRSSADYGKVDVALGVLQTINRNNVHQQQFRVIGVKTHDSYNFPENDVAVVRLHRRAALGRFVNVICMPDGETPKTGELCFATGYGATSFGGPAAEGLQEVDLPITDIDECAAVYENSTDTTVNTETMICAGNREGTKDTCQGDSGGPLVCQRCNNCDWYLAGITSFGRGCAMRGFYGVYSSVVYHEEWIAANTDVTVTKGTCIKPSWTNWGAWADCPVTCGGGIRQRIRFCQNGVKGDPDCLGDDIGTLMCNVNICDDSAVVAPVWTTWTSWSSCSFSCGGGVRTRGRTCSAPTGGECVGMSSEEMDCNPQDCPVWGPFGDFGACDKSCGTGQQRRTRECMNGDPGDIGCVGREFIERECNSQDCPVWMTWTTWTDCTETCGPGTQTGSRMCQNGNQGQDGCQGPITRSRTCMVVACPGEWSEWGSCSVSCRTGQQTRSRTTSTGNMDQNRDCTVNTRCPTWAAWTTWSDCTESCGRGSQTSTRTCNNGDVGQIGCVGTASRTRDCNTFDCPSWGVFGPYGDCSASCGGGTQARDRTCEGGNPEGTGCPGRSTMAVNCNTHPCPTWGQWSNFDDCDVTCGGGMQNSMRECMNGVAGDDGCEGLRRRRRGCNNQDCPVFSDWSEFGDCSVTCGGGTRERTRTCPLPNLCPADQYGAILTDSVACNDEICPGVWREWEPVGECTQTCGPGAQGEERTCMGGTPGGPGCPGESNRVVTCNLRDCPFWAEWNEFGDCSVTCGDGQRTRTRVCTEVGACAGEGMESEGMESEACNVQSCDTDTTDSCIGLEDINNNCPQFTSLGYCTDTNFRQFVTAQCAKSCCEINVGCPLDLVDSILGCNRFFHWCTLESVRRACARTCECGIGN